MSREKTLEATLEQPLRKKWFLAALAIATFSTGMANSTLTIFATDIAKSLFGSATYVQIASVTQLSTLNMAAEVSGAIVLSVLAIKFRHKRLLSIGTAFIVASTIGSYLAPNLLTLQVFFALEGIGSVIIGVIAAVLIVEYLPENQRAKVISYLFSIGSAVTLVLIPLVGIAAEMGGWRFTILALGVPISILGLILTMFIVPSRLSPTNQANKSKSYVEGFRQIVKNKSATACLIANLLTIAGTEVAIFAIAFYKTQFAASTSQTIIVYETAMVLFILAPLVSGRLVTRFGAKKIAIVSTFIAACFTGVFFFIPNFWFSFVLDMAHVWFAAMALPAFAVLVLQQIPKYRATLFSLNNLFNNVGKVLAPLIGGLLLVASSGMYGAVGLTLAGTTVIGCVILFFAVKNSGDTQVF
jgi:predicted MFS family arabinose efflux permease